MTEYKIDLENAEPLAAFESFEEDIYVDGTDGIKKQKIGTRLYYQEHDGLCIGDKVMYNSRAYSYDPNNQHSHGVIKFFFIHERGEVCVRYESGGHDRAAILERVHD